MVVQLHAQALSSTFGSETNEVAWKLDGHGPAVVTNVHPRGNAATHVPAGVVHVTACDVPSVEASPLGLRGPRSVTSEHPSAATTDDETRAALNRARITRACQTPSITAREASLRLRRSHAARVPSAKELDRCNKALQTLASLEAKVKTAGAPTPMKDKVLEGKRSGVANPTSFRRSASDRSTTLRSARRT